MHGRPLGTGLTLSALHVWSASAQEPPSLKAEPLDVADPSLRTMSPAEYELDVSAGDTSWASNHRRNPGDLFRWVHLQLRQDFRYHRSFVAQFWPGVFPNAPSRLVDRKFSPTDSTTTCQLQLAFGGLNLRNGDLKTFVSNGS